MNADRIAGLWKQITGKIKAQWGNLTEDDVVGAAGGSQYLAGKLQERYGIAKDEVDKRIKEIQRSL